MEPVDLKGFEKWFKKLSNFHKVILLALVTGTLVFFLLSASMTVLRAVKPVPMTEERYLLLLSEVDKRRWKIAKSSLEAFHRQIHGSPSGYAYTKREGDRIDLSLSGEVDTTYSFWFKDGLVRGFVSSYPAILSYSESTLKSGRALTLEVVKDKLVFYEEK